MHLKIHFYNTSHTTLHTPELLAQSNCVNEQSVGLGLGFICADGFLCPSCGCEVFAHHGVERFVLCEE